MKTLRLVFHLYYFSSLCTASFAEDRVAQIESQLLEKRNQAMQQFDSNISDAEKRKVAEEWRSFALEAIDQLHVIAKNNPSDRTGLMASVAIISNCNSGYGPHINATQIILEHHLDYSEFESICRCFYGLDPVYEKILRKLITFDDANVRIWASFTLAEILFDRAELKDDLESSSVDRERLSKDINEESFIAIERSNSDDDRDEALILYEQVIVEGGEIAWGDGTLSSKAEGRASLLRNHSYLKVGSTAPELYGKTIEGNSMNLRDLRGSVVAVTFWASWCGPCLAQMPEKMELYERLKEKGFVLLGVNADDSLEEARTATDQNKISFESIWDDPNNEDRIVVRWGVRGWPTTIVVDQNGVIKSRSLSEEFVQQLLKGDCNRYGKARRASD